MSNSDQILADIEKYITTQVRINDCLTLEEIPPTQLVRQIAEDLVQKRFIWIGNQTYVPSKLVGTLFLHDTDKLEELEVIFNSAYFTRLLHNYINSCGFKTFDALKVEIKSADSANNTESFQLEFCWPTEAESVEDVTVKVDKSQGRILEVYDLKPEIPQLARLTLLSGEAYRENYLITKKVTYIGRLRNVIDRENNIMIRRNDFIFARNLDENSPNSSVSRQHATIKFVDGKFFVHDNGSANGTSIERAGVAPLEVLPGNPHGVRLENYDIIRFGTAIVRFEDKAKMIGVSIDKDAVEPQLAENELMGEIQTTVKLTREQIENEMNKILNTE